MTVCDYVWSGPSPLGAGSLSSYRGFTQPDPDPPFFRTEEYLEGLVKDVVQDDTETLRYWPAHETPPAGWRDVAALGPHLYRGKIIVKIDD